MTVKHDITPQGLHRALGTSFFHFLESRLQITLDPTSTEAIDPESVLGIISTVALMPKAHHIELRDMAGRLRRLLGSKVRHTQALNTIAMAMGYDAWPAVTRHLLEGVVINGHILTSLEEKDRYHAWPVTTINLLTWDLKKDGLPEGYTVQVAKNHETIEHFQTFFRTLMEERDSVKGKHMLAYARKELSAVRINRTLVRAPLDGEDVLVPLQFYGSIKHWMDRCLPKERA